MAVETIPQPCVRPYSKAVFEVAQEHNALDAWRDTLDCLAEIVKDDFLRQVLGQNICGHTQIQGIILAILEKAAPQAYQAVSDHVSALLVLLIRHDRLLALPALAQAFQDRMAQAAGQITVELSTAKSLSEQQLKAVQLELAKRLGAKVELNTVVESHLLAGFVARSGHWVWDCSLENQLSRLNDVLKGTT